MTKNISEEGKARRNEAGKKNFEEWNKRRTPEQYAAAAEKQKKTKEGAEYKERMRLAMDKVHGTARHERKPKPHGQRGTTRHKPGWGRTFAADDKFQNDAFFWKLFDIVMLRDADAWKNIKEPHSEAYNRLNPNSGSKVKKEI